MKEYQRYIKEFYTRPKNGYVDILVWDNWEKIGKPYFDGNLKDFIDNELFGDIKPQDIIDNLEIKGFYKGDMRERLGITDDGPIYGPHRSILITLKDD